MSHATSANPPQLGSSKEPPTQLETSPRRAGPGLSPACPDRLAPYLTSFSAQAEDDPRRGERGTPPQSID